MDFSGEKKNPQNWGENAKNLGFTWGEGILKIGEKNPKNWDLSQEGKYEKLGGNPQNLGRGGNPKIWDLRGEKNP